MFFSPCHFCGKLPCLSLPSLSLLSANQHSTYAQLKWRTTCCCVVGRMHASTFALVANTQTRCHKTHVNLLAISTTQAGLHFSCTVSTHMYKYGLLWVQNMVSADSETSSASTERHEITVATLVLFMYSLW